MGGPGAGPRLFNVRGTSTLGQLAGGPISFSAIALKIPRVAKPTPATPVSTCKKPFQTWRPSTCHRIGMFRVLTFLKVTVPALENGLLSVMKTRRLQAHKTLAA